MMIVAFSKKNAHSTAKLQRHSAIFDIASRINAFNVEKLCVERGSTSRHINVHYVYTTHEAWS